MGSVTKTPPVDTAEGAAMPFPSVVDWSGAVHQAGVAARLIVPRAAEATMSLLDGSDDCEALYRRTVAVTEAADVSNQLVGSDDIHRGAHPSLGPIPVAETRTPRP